MAEDKHTEDLRNVQQGDLVKITTTQGDSFAADCQDYSVEHAAERSGEVRETRIWTFKAGSIDGPVTIYATILDGLKSSDDDPEFPQHSALWNEDAEINMGYVEDVRVYGHGLEA